MIANLSALLPVLLALSRIAAAVPADLVVRADDDKSATATPTAWASVVDDGTLTTITPTVSTDSAGKPTTINAKPTETAAPSNDEKDNDDDDDDDDDIVTQCDSSKYELAESGNKQPFIPFCAPRNATKWRVDGNYYLTWNSGYWDKNSSVKIVLNYVDAGGKGKVAKTWETSNSFGFINVEPSKDWLLNQTALDEGHDRSMANQTMYFTIADNSPSASKNVKNGPTIIITSKPTAAPVDTTRPPVSTFGLAVGLPLMVVFIVGCVLGLHFCMRNKRTVGPLSIGGGRRHFSKRGYSGRAMRRQKAAMATSEAEYRDEPEDITPTAPQPKRGEWELTSVQGGR